MLTPLGHLKTLDLDDPEVQKQVLYYDKHQLLEGLVAEHMVDQILDTMIETEAGLVRLDVVSVVGATRGSEHKHVFVLDQGTQAELLDEYLEKLRGKFTVHLVCYDDGQKDFLTHRGEYKRQKPLDIPLQSEMETIQTKPRAFPEINPKVKDEIRQNQGFWGYLSGAYEGRIGTHLVLHRLFKNFAIQPYFDGGVWDIDRVCRGISGKFYVLEVKHKFPYGSSDYPLKFGINQGSALLLLDLALLGFQCFHSIMVKPFWKDNRSVMYLLNDLAARRNVFFCGKLFTESQLLALTQSKVFFSPKKTTLTGEGELGYHSFPVSDLYRMDLLDSKELPRYMARGLKNRLRQFVTDEELRSYKLG